MPASVTLWDISTLPDNYDHSDAGKWSASDHYVDIPSQSYYFRMEDSSCTGECVVNSIFNYTAILLSEKPNFSSQVCKTDGSKEPCPLSFLVHYVGDCHQPMHVAYTDDKGGNNFDVSFFGHSTNLHSVWDGQIIDRYLNGSKWPDLATELTNWANSHSQQRSWIQAETNEVVWANESFSVAQNVAYNFIPGYGGISVEEVPHTKSKGAAEDIALYYKSLGSSDAPNETPYTPSRDELGCAHARAGERSVDATYVTYIGDPYYTRSLRFVKARLVEGGLRLASLLTDIYG